MLTRIRNKPSHGIRPRSIDPKVQHAATLNEFNAVVRERGHCWLAIARRYFPCEADCADAVQDALLAAVRHLPRFRGGCKLETWLHRIVVNACLMKLRTQRRKATVPLDAHDPALPEPEIEHPLWNEDTRHAVRAALRQLPEHQRTVIQLRYFENFSTAQTAELLGLHVAAVKTRLHRSCRALQRQLQSTLRDAE